METLRIIMVTTHYPPHHIGGDAVMVENLSNELALRGHEVHVFRNIGVYNCLRGRDCRAPERSSILENGVTIHEFAGANVRRTAATSLLFGVEGKAIAQLEELVKKLNPDAVHWHNTKAFIGTPRPFSSAVNAYTAHDYFAVCPKSSLLKPGNRICHTPSLCQLCLIESRKTPQLWRVGRNRVVNIPLDMKIIAPSDFVASRLRSDNLRVARVIPNFVRDPGRIAYESNRNALIYVGILEPHKGPDVLLDAFASTTNRHDLILKIVGEGSMKTQLAERAKELGVADRVTITGRIANSELRLLLSKAVASVIPSIWFENCPLVALESLSFGVPILASRIGGLTEIATKEAGSMTFSPGNRKDLADEITRIGTESGKDENLRHLARKAYEDKYSPVRNISIYLDTLSQRVD